MTPPTPHPPSSTGAPCDPALLRTTTLTRRGLLMAGGATAALAATSGGPAAAAAHSRRGGWVPAPSVGSSGIQTSEPGSWLGPDVWGNRLADWEAADGGWQCVAVEGRRGLCTASLLTRRLTGDSASLRVRVSPDRAGRGFAGFLLGTGTDDEYRRTALVGTASGTGGGLLAVVDDTGQVSLRDHTAEADQFSYPQVSAAASGPGMALADGDVVDLVVSIAPVDDQHVTLSLTVSDSRGRRRSQVVQHHVARDTVAGGIAMVSGADDDGPLWRLTELDVSGQGVEEHGDRAMGAILGTLFSLSGGLLKMTAQVAPFDRRDDDLVVLETLAADGSWTQAATAPVGVGYVAVLRVAHWDATTDVEYRVRHSRVAGTWGGRVPAEPSGAGQVTVATVNCSKATHRSVDRTTRLDGGLDGRAPMPLYAAANVWFPYEATFAAVAAHEPDVLVAMGDQYYESSPTAEDPSADPELDFLYKYLMWLWAVRDLAKDRPTLVLVDDHDVFQGNLWGDGGIAAPAGQSTSGGYEKRASWVNLVQRVQCGHNPDPVDPAPVAQGINVYFTRFDYAGVTFVILEDRKFKSSPVDARTEPDSELQLLGARQEAMLAQLARDKQARPTPTVVLTQTVYAGVETTADGQPTGIQDSGGFPKGARDRALGSIAAAGAVMLSGDTHLSTLVRHLDVGGATGPLQFTGPAVASTYQRWFSPATALPGGRGLPDTGRASDLFGNTFEVLAVANPLLSQSDAAARGNEHNVGQRSLKQEGYGICEIDLAARTYQFASWPGDQDPTSPDAAPYPGWPWTLDFDDA